MVSYQNKGFSLIEILVVLGIMAILFSGFFYFWNSTQSFKKVRDSRRISDLQVIDAAIKNLLASSFNFNLGEENVIYISLPDASSTCGNYNLNKVYSPFSYRCQTITNYLRVDGNGWLPINFSSSSVIVLSSLPKDPLNNSEYFYAYLVKNGRYKLTARFEDQYFIKKMTEDGGLEPTLYELGSDLRLPSPHSGLVLYLPFNEGTGTIAYDYSGYNNNGILYSGSSVCSDPPTTGCPQWVSGKVGKALNFDGVDDYIWLGDPESLKVYKFTLTGWLKTIAGTSFQQIYRWRRYGIAIGAPVIGGISGRGGVGFYNSAAMFYKVETKTGINDGNSHFLVGTYDKSALKIYLDGNLNNQLSIPAEIYYAPGGAAIGRDGDYSIYYFNGLIDEVRVYNRALSDQEIKAIYEATK
ncbi:MAG: hypothetical protein KatS3mg093_210 [Candidatus Parcubacteria bacterium]|nr:MAG: hypothetical protein KatS3mg093_210 [Candidatus Parcubacteria bacterium]